MAQKILEVLIVGGKTQVFWIEKMDGFSTGPRIGEKTETIRPNSAIYEGISAPWETINALCTIRFGLASM